MADATTTYRPVGPFDLRATLAPLQRGTGDLTQRVGADGTVWRTVRTSAGAATLALRHGEDRAVAVAAWGPGADAALAGVADLLGERDDPTGFVPRHPRVAEAWRCCRGLRIARCGRVFDTLVPAVLEQRVTGVEARRDVSNVTFPDLVRLVESLGFRAAGGRGSHRVFSHPAVTELINLQEERGQAKRYQVRQVASLVQRYDLRLEEEP